MTTGFVLVIYVLVGTVLVGFLHLVGQRGRVLTPIAFFVGIEIIAVWPALLPVEDGPLESVGMLPALLAAVGLFGTVVVYVVLGGSQANALQWRGSSLRPNEEAMRSLMIGLIALITCLVVIGLISFRGLPPLLTGSLSSLLDPVANSDQVGLIREARRTRTKGHLVLGEQYTGQGVFNTVTEIGWQVAVIGSVLYWSWRRTRRSVNVVAGVGLLAFIFLGSGGARSPLVICCIAGVAAVALSRPLRTRSIAAALAIGLGFVLLIMPLSKGATGGVTISERTIAMVERISEGNGQNNAQIVRLINTGGLDVQNGGLFIEQLKAMVPGVNEGIPFTLQLTHLAYGGGSQTTGYATPTQFGLMYADFSFAGVLVGYLLSGVVLALGWRLITRIRHPFGSLIAVQGAIILGYLSVTGITGVVSQALVAALLILLVCGPVGWSALASAILRPQKGKTRQDKARQGV